MAMAVPGAVGPCSPLARGSARTVAARKRPRLAAEEQPPPVRPGPADTGPADTGPLLTDRCESPPLSLGQGQSYTGRVLERYKALPLHLKAKVESWEIQVPPSPPTLPNPPFLSSPALPPGLLLGSRRRAALARAKSLVGEVSLVGLTSPPPPFWPAEE